MGKVYLRIICFLWLTTSLAAQPVKGAHESSWLGKERHYSLDITVSVLKEGKTLSSSHLKKISAEGQPVAIAIDGGRVRLKCYIIPFQKEGSKIVLLVRSEIWVTDDKGEQHYTAVEEIDATHGDNIVYYPLGIAPKGEATLTINMIIDDAK